MAPLMPGRTGEAVGKGWVVEPLKSVMAFIDQSQTQIWNPYPQGGISAGNLARWERGIARGVEQLVHVRPKRAITDLPPIGSDLL